MEGFISRRPAEVSLATALEGLLYALVPFALTIYYGLSKAECHYYVRAKIFAIGQHIFFPSLVCAQSRLIYVLADRRTNIRSMSHTYPVPRRPNLLHKTAPRNVVRSQLTSGNRME